MSTLFFPNHFSSENQTLTRPSNKCSPIYTLPNELLEEIFYTTIPAWHLNTDRSEDFDEGGRVRLRATVILASVSYRWHELVHGCPRMWATLHGGLDLNDIKFLLSKSKNAPLFIACGLLSDFLAELIKPHIHRWSSFNVHTSKLEISSMKSLLTEEPAPLLESFRMVETTFDVSETPTILFSGNAPRLQHLVAIAYPLLWEPKGLGGLRELQIRASHTTHPGAPSQFFHLLESSSPLLEALTIYLQIHDSRPSYQWVLSVVAFPKLKRLWLEHPPRELVEFIFSFLRASSSLRLFIRAKSSTIFPPSLPNDNPLVTAFSQCQKIKIFHHHWHFRISGENITMQDDIRVTGAEKFNRKWQVCVSIMFYDTAAPRIYELLSFPGCMAQITSLWILLQVVDKQQGIFDIFIYLENLVDLHLDSWLGPVSSFFFAFLASRQAIKSGLLIWPCINLLNLTMTRVDCDIKDMISCIDSRCRNTKESPYPCRMRTLTIKHPTSSITEEEISLLQTMVDNCDIINM